MRTPTRLTAVAAAAVLTVGLAACSSSGGAKPSPSTTSTAAPLASYPTLRGSSTTVTLAKSFAGTLARFGLAPQLVAPATGTASSLTFPVSGGSATVWAKGAHTPQLVGTVRHSGALRLAAQGRSVELKNVTLTLGATPKLEGTVLLGGQPVSNSAIALFDLDPSTMTAPAASSTTTLRGLTVYVDPNAAAALNLGLGLTGAKALPTGARAITVGIATVVLRG